MNFKLIILCVILLGFIVLYIIDVKYGLKEMVYPSSYAKFILKSEESIKINGTQNENNLVKIHSGWNQVENNLGFSKNIYFEKNASYVYFLQNDNNYVKIDPNIKFMQLYNNLEDNIIIIFSNSKKKIAIKINQKNIEKLNMLAGRYDLLIKSGDNKKTLTKKDSIEIKENQIFIFNFDNSKFKLFLV